mmetsp:Transcript_20693/g.34137  ORF Transcript_20693/g.34137 Transcript_20693/m.34137 type:complete len:441 (-) Transcript_20693:43-1365(-)
MYAKRRDPYQTEFLESVQELATDVAVVIEQAPKLAWVFKQLMEPERLITFRVPWTDDNGNARINRGYRIQYSSALGHFHGGIRFDPNLSHGGVRMLGWEQTLKNALTGCNLGGSRGGSDFDPSTKSENEIKRFCDSFMTELYDFIGPEFDTVETDRGCGKREMADLQERYVALDIEGGAGDSLDHLDTSVGNAFGAGAKFPQASGFGSVYFAQRAIESRFNDSLIGKKCLISGAGTFSTSTALKLVELGAIPITFSDSSGYIVSQHGFTRGDIENIAHYKNGGGSLREYAKGTNCKFSSVGSLWEQVPGDIAFPSYVQGELNADDASMLADNGCKAVFENADRACSSNAQIIFEERDLLFAPSKAVNGGSVIASVKFYGNEEDQPSISQLDEDLKQEMIGVHDRILETAEKHGRPGDLRAGANLNAFIRIANSPMYRLDL